MKPIRKTNNFRCWSIQIGFRWSTTLVFAVEGGIAITWEDNSGIGSALATDKLRVIAISGDQINVLQGVNITRDAEVANILLPYGAGVEAQVYVFFESVEYYTFSEDSHGVVNIS